MKKNWDKGRGLFLLLILALAIAVVVAGFYGYRYWNDMFHLNRLKENVPIKVQTILQEIEKQDAEEIFVCLHPVADKYGAQTKEGITELLEVMNGRTVSQLQLPAPKTWERGEGEYLAKSTGTVTLSDGSQYSLTYTYLLDGSEGFINFLIENRGVNV